MLQQEIDHFVTIEEHGKLQGIHTSPAGLSQFSPHLYQPSNQL